MSFLPNDEERDWMARSLRELIRIRGFEPFACVPLLTPSDDDFPDPWDGSVRAAHRITQRLMQHAGIGNLGISLTALPDDDAAPDDVWDAGKAGWFSGIDRGRARFGIEPKEVGDPQSVAGIMAHEVAHAWRHSRELVEADREVEEHLTDLTTVYLGFGILTTNVTERYRTWRKLRASVSQLKSMGYLPPPAMSWLLALQASARNDRSEREAIRRHLEPNQRGWFDESINEIAADPRHLDSLMLPPRESRPRAARKLVTVVEPGSDEIREAPSPVERGLTTRHAGQTAYRIDSTSMAIRFFLGAWLGAIAGLIAASIAGASFGILEGTRTMQLLVGGGAIAGAAVALLRPRIYRCSDISCREIVPKDAMACPHCGSSFASTLTPRQWRDVQAEDLERNAAGIEFTECEDCQPEEPCPRHAGDEAL
ncbi:MAG TPA: hypothetical protein VEZ11_13715 [Thermoanaerobaculia bacterium]|nr:hypothetical protein [Thermoanaerobaculia bacterium]